MPGKRLTLKDRSAVAKGLAEGLTYSEIAAKLKRPTSTITREVIRNGGAEHYRADRAHRQTIRRRRRRRGASRETFARTARDESLREVSTEFTAMMVAIGLPRISARVLACLYLTDSGILTAGELVACLAVSPASISKAVGELAHQGLIRRERDPGTRRERYVIDQDAWFESWLRSAGQNAMLAAFANRASRALGPETPAGARFQDIGDFFERVGRAMLETAELWRASARAHRGDTPSR